MNASPAQPPAASPAHDPDELARRLGTSDAAVIGVGSMVGAGVFERGDGRPPRGVGCEHLVDEFDGGSASPLRCSEQVRVVSQLR